MSDEQPDERRSSSGGQHHEAADGRFGAKKALWMWTSDVDNDDDNDQSRIMATFEKPKRLGAPAELTSAVRASDSKPQPSPSHFECHHARLSTREKSHHSCAPRLVQPLASPLLPNSQRPDPSAIVASTEFPIVFRWFLLPTLMLHCIRKGHGFF